MRVQREGERHALRRIVPAVTVAVAVAVAAGCGSSDSSSTSSGTSSSGSAKSTTPLVFGSLVGPAAEGGPDFERGVQIAAKRINDAGGIEGRKLVIKEFKKELDTASAVKTYRQAASDKSVLTAWGGAGGGLAIKAQTAREKLPFFAAQGTKEMYDPVAPYGFSITPDGEFATSSLRYAIDNNPNAKKIGILHYDSDYDLSLSAAIKNRCTAPFQVTADAKPEPPLGCTVVADETASTTASVDSLIPQMTKLKNSGADIYYVGCGNPNGAKAARQLGMFDKPVICDQNLAVPAIATAAGKAAEGMVFGGSKCAGGDAIPAGDPTRKWCDDFKKQYTVLYPSEQFSNYAIYGDDVVSIFADACSKLIKAGKEVTRDNLRDQYEKFDGTLRTSQGLVKSSAKNHRLTGSWPESYVNYDMKIVGGKPVYSLAPKAKPEGADF